MTQFLAFTPVRILPPVPTAMKFEATVATACSVALVPEPDGFQVAAGSAETRIVPLAPTVTILPLGAVATAVRFAAVPETRGVVVPEGSTVMMVPPSPTSTNLEPVQVTPLR